MRASLAKWMVVSGMVLLGLVLASAMLMPLLRGPGGGTGGEESGTELGPERHLPEPTSDAATRIAAAQDLGRQKAADARAVVFLKQCLKAAEPGVRAAALEAFGRVADKANLMAVLDKLNDVDGQVRVAALRALPKFNDPSCVSWLREPLADPDPQVRLAAVEARACFNDDGLVPALTEALQDKDAAVAGAARSHLARLGGPALERLAAAAARAGPRARVGMVQTIAARKDPQDVPALVALLTAATLPPRGPAALDPALRAAAVEAIVAMGEPAIEPLRRAAIDTVGQLPLKQVAAEALVRIGTPAAIAPMRDRILRWRDVPSEEELALWLDALGRIQSDPAQQALAQVHRHVEAIRQGAPVAEGTQHGELPRWVPAQAGPSPHAKGPLKRPGVPGGFTGEFQVVLRKGLPTSRQPSELVNLVLDLEAEEGAWNRVWPLAFDYGHGVHTGQVLQADVLGDRLRLRLGVVMGDDTWNKGGTGVYRLDLARDDRGRLEGTFEGEFEGCKVSGKAEGAMKPPRPVRVANFTPPVPGEHPRLLFRKSDLPALRAKFKTPFGQAYREMAYQARSDPINLGVLYQLTGDPAYADEAMKIVKGYLANLDPSGCALMSDSIAGVGSGGYGHRGVRAALALDLCYDAWPEDFRRQLIDAFTALLPEHQTHVMIEHPNPHPCSNYYGPGRGAPAIVTLVLWGEPGPEPPRPADPAAQAVALAPAKDYQPGAGVPVVDFSPGRTPRAWLCAGPAPVKIHPDVLEDLVQSGRARPQVGSATTVNFMAGGRPQEATLAFQVLGERFMDARGEVDLSKLTAPDRPATVLLYTVLRVAQEQTVGLVKGQRDTTVWLAGAELAEKGCYRLAPGLYPMLVVHATDKPAGAIGPRLEPAGGGALAYRRAAHEIALAAWQVDHGLWEQGVDPVKMRLFDVGRQQCYNHYRMGIGDGGFQAETGGYADIASWYPLVYASLYYKMFGRDACGYPDVAYLVPRRMMQVFFRAGGKAEVHKINSAAGFRPDWCAAALPMAPDRFKPALLWAWNQVCGVTDETSAARVLDRQDGLDLADAFVNYPLDMKPEHPAKVMPLAWEARTFGYHCFRSGWQGRDEFISQVFAKASLIKGWNHPNAGTFRVFGLGRPWVAGSYDRVGFRLQEPCVLLPDDDTNEGACGRVAYLKTEADGSAVLTVDLADVYSRDARLYDGNLLRWPERFVASGISGLRAYAFDYSSAAGAPCLMVLVDQITGGRRREWLWPLPQGALARTKVDGNTFATDYGDASMKVTFVAPEGAKVEAVGENVQVGELGNRHGSFEGRLERIKAQAGPGTSFFVVATFQAKDAPVVKVEGAGLDARVTVGRRTVRFDGEKVVLGP
jgi:HEAT repeat protein